MKRAAAFLSFRDAVASVANVDNKQANKLAYMRLAIHTVLGGAETADVIKESTTRLRATKTIDLLTKVLQSAHIDTLVQAFGAYDLLELSTADMVNYSQAGDGNDHGMNLDKVSERLSMFNAEDPVECEPRVIGMLLAVTGLIGQAQSGSSEAVSAVETFISQHPTRHRNACRAIQRDIPASKHGTIEALTLFLQWAEHIEVHDPVAVDIDAMQRKLIAPSLAKAVSMGGSMFGSAPSRGIPEFASVPDDQTKLLALFVLHNAEHTPQSDALKDAVWGSDPGRAATDRWARSIVSMTSNQASIADLLSPLDTAELRPKVPNNIKNLLTVTFPPSAMITEVTGTNRDAQLAKLCATLLLPTGSAAVRHLARPTQSVASILHKLADGIGPLDASVFMRDLCERCGLLAAPRDGWTLEPGMSQP